MSDSKVLIVDDEPQLLEGLQRQLRKRFDLDVALGPIEALSKLEHAGPFAVIVSDMRMPGMNGVELLDRCKQIAPETIRMMLTGNSDQTTAVDAINRGSIFKFLNKPCSSAELASAIDEALTAFRLTTLEHDVMVRTVSGSISLLADLIGLLQPSMARRANRIRGLISQITDKLSCKNAWEIRIAANLCEIGCIAIDPEVVRKISGGESLERDELAEFQRHAEIGKRLVSKIPRLEGVGEMIGAQFNPYMIDEAREARPQEIAVGANIIGIAVDFEQARAGDVTASQAVESIASNYTRYESSVLKTFLDVMQATEEIRMLRVFDLRDGMIIDEDVFTMRGDLLVAKGQIVVGPLRERLLMFSQSQQQVREPFRVRCKTHSG